MVDLGKHATDVLMAYAVALALLFALVFVSIAKAKKTAKRLSEVEKRSKAAKPAARS